MAMEMLIYSSGKGNNQKRLQGMIDTMVHGEKAKVYRTIEDLSAKLRYPNADYILAVLVPNNRNDLFNLVSIGHLFDGTRIVVVAPDYERETISLAHKLRPRLLSHIENDFMKVIAVLNNIIRDYQDVQHL